MIETLIISVRKQPSIYKDYYSVYNFSDSSSRGVQFEANLCTLVKNESKFPAYRISSNLSDSKN